MSDQHTRYVRLSPDVHRESAINQGTRVCLTRERVVLTDHRSLFNHHQRRMSQVLRELSDPGVAIFALHPVHGIVGRLWLSATTDLRAGTIGRHSNVDLHLPHDEELSLRHLLLLVRLASGGPRIQVLDLATPGGFQAEQGGVLRSVEANGALILRAASYSLFLFPTGAPTPWDPGAADSWLTLPKRVLVADERSPRFAPRRSLHAFRVSPEQTNVAFREGPSEPGPEPLIERGERVEGHLDLFGSGVASRLAVDACALNRGVILGRYARCSGDTLVMSEQTSRVHAMFVRVGGVLHVVDAGSTNGTWRGEPHESPELKCEPVIEGQPYAMGHLRARWEPIQ